MTDLIRKYDGRKILVGETLHTVHGEIHGRPAIKIVSPEGLEHEMPIEEFRLQVSLGNVMSPDGRREGGRLASPQERLEARFREEVLRLSAELGDQGYTWPARVEEIKRRLAANPAFASREKPFPTPRSIQNWRSKSLREGRSALEDKRFQSGNRTDRHDWRFEEIVYDLVEDQYLASDRKTVNALARDARVRYLADCVELGVEPGPHGEKVVRSLIERLPHADVVKRRLGSKDAQRALLQAGKFQKVAAPLERVEIDSTVANVFVIVDEERNVARPTICAAIDAATGVTVGLQVSLDSPTSIMTALTIREIMTPKPSTFFDEYGIENRLQAYGRPLALVADQGPENSGDLIERCLKTVDFEFRKNTPGHPDKKPFIERFFGTLKQFLKNFPGATETADMPDKTRIKKAMDEASLTLEEFIGLVQKWRYDVYAQLPRRIIQSALRTQESPSACWRRLSDEYLVPEPPDAHEIREMFLAGAATRKLHRYGIEFEAIQYSSPELRALFKEMGPGQSLEIRFDPTDIRAIAVFNPLAREHMLVAAKEEGLPALSLYELKQIRKELAPDPAETLTAERIYAAMAEQLHRGRQKPGTPYRKAKQNAARARRDQAIIDNTRTPITHEQSLIESAQAANKPLTRPASLARITPKAPK